MKTIKVCQICFTSMPKSQFKRHMKESHGVVSEIKRSGSTDPLVQSVKKVRREWRKTPVGRLQTLLDQERKWKRRATIAANKLADVRLAINDFAAKQCVNPNERPTP